MEAYCQTIKNFYSRPELSQFVLDQMLQLSVEHSVALEFQQINITVRIPIDLSIFQKKFPLQTKAEAQFLIVIGKGYPIHAPKVYLRSQLTEVPVNDCRNMIKDVLKQWNHKITLRVLVQSLPTFLQKLSKANTRLKLQKMGDFVLNTRYQMRFLNKLGCQIYFSFQSTPKNIFYHFVVLTHTHILIFRPETQPFIDSNTQRVKLPGLSEINWVYLSLVAQIQSLKQISISKENDSQVLLNFSSTKIAKMKVENRTTMKKLKIENCIQFINRVLHRIGKFQPLDVQLKTNPYIESRQWKVLEKSSLMDKSVRVQRSVQNIQSANQAYREAVQYYEGKNSPYYLVFMKKLEDMYSKEDTKELLTTVSQ